jgi:predicted O-methyltransferase YrrM
MINILVWTPMVLPVIKTIEHHLKPGCVLIADNTIGSAEGYKDYFGYINASNSPYTTVTLPYHNGLEMTVYRPREEV